MFIILTKQDLKEITLNKNHIVSCEHKSNEKNGNCTELLLITGNSITVLETKMTIDRMLII